MRYPKYKDLLKLPREEKIKHCLKILNRRKCTIIAIGLIYGPVDIGRMCDTLDSIYDLEMLIRSGHMCNVDLNGLLYELSYEHADGGYKTYYRYEYIVDNNHIIDAVK